MKYILFFLTIFSINAQDTIQPITDKIAIPSEPVIFSDGSPMYEEGQRVLYFNPRKNVAVFFPEKIRQALTGSENVTFTYNTADPQFFGILKGIKSGDSNLLVITTDGQIYSFLLRYQYDIPNQNYFIQKDESIGNENPQITQLQNEVREDIADNDQDYEPIFESRNYDPNFSDFETVDFRKTPKDTAYLYYNKDRIDYMKRFSSNLTGLVKTNGISDQNNDIKLSLLAIHYKYNEMYFVIEVENNSGVDYDVNLLDISVANNRKKRRKSAQTILKKPVFTYQLLSRIPRKSVKRIVYVLPKFSINKEKKVIIELNEFGGERNITLDVPMNVINNPI